MDFCCFPAFKLTNYNKNVHKHFKCIVWNLIHYENQKYMYNWMSSGPSELYITESSLTKRSRGLLLTGINKPSLCSKPKGICPPFQNSGLAEIPTSSGWSPFMGTSGGISHSSSASLCALFAWAEVSSVQPWWKRSCTPTASVRAHKHTQEKGGVKLCIWTFLLDMSRMMTDDHNAYHD